MRNIVEIKNGNHYCIIRLFGEVDVETITQARPLIVSKISPDCDRFIVDLSLVSFLDSHGIGFFVSLLKHAQAQEGKLIFLGAEAQPLSLLKMVGFNSALVAYCDTMEEALSLVS